MLTRRSLLSTAVIGGGAAALTACVNGANGPQIDPALINALPTTFTDAVQSLVAKGCNLVNKYSPYIPTVASIAASILALVPTVSSAAAAVEAGAVTVEKIASDLCAAAPAPATPAAGRLAARLRGSSPGNPVTIGRAPSGVVVKGYQV